jgi:hypothetical protein
MDWANIFAIVKDVISIGAGLTLVVTILARFLPNEKIYNFGYVLGIALSKIGQARLGVAATRKIELFLENSLRQITYGFCDGLDSDDGGVKQTFPKIDKSTTVKK